MRALLLLLLAVPSSAELFVTHAELRLTWREDEEGRRLSEPAAAGDLWLNTHLLLRGAERALAGGGGVRVLSGPLREKIEAAFRDRTVLFEHFPAEEMYFSVAPVRRTAPTGRIGESEVVFAGELSVTYGLLLSGAGCSVLHPEGLLILDHGLRRRVERAVLARAAASGACPR